MKEMNKIERFTDKEWEELASVLSDEKDESSDLLKSFMAEDDNSGKQWKELKNMNSKEEINVDNAWNKVYSRLNENNLIKREVSARTIFMRPAIMRVAAVALILLSLGSAAIYMNNAGYFSKKIGAIAGNEQKNVLISLPDGSKIYLNRNSELSYRTNYGKHGRDVKLTGEAFFEIAPDISKPFIIDAGKAKVKVVGTSFNVITNNRDSSVEVFVKTGKVEVYDNSRSQTLHLDPGYVGTIDSKTSGKTVNSDPNYLSWKTGYLYYTNQKLNIVFKDLKRVYNMDIVADDPDILEYPWHSPIDNSSQEIIINLICRSFNLGYTKDGIVFHLTKK
jgi:transmembrane sensor